VEARRPRPSQAGTMRTRPTPQDLLGTVRIWLLAVCLLISGVTPLYRLQAFALSSEELEWLRERSILLQAPRLEKQFARGGQQWRYPYGRARPDDFLQRGSVWLAVYPDAVIRQRGRSVLQTLGDPVLRSSLVRVAEGHQLSNAGSITHLPRPRRSEDRSWPH